MEGAISILVIEPRMSDGNKEQRQGRNGGRREGGDKEVLGEGIGRAPMAHIYHTSRKPRSVGFEFQVVWLSPYF